ncbi:MAG: peptidyl-prolyl cis-trans isomerase [Deltaproteobacteria bacterium]|nr:MAG: peptidyl-prolyl cis-trans isomerase [Deltaproteobacteria bacterium]
MRNLTVTVLSLLFFVLACASFAAAGPLVAIETNYGAIRIELDEAKAPISVKNFLDYADKGFYDGTIFHRVIKDFMIQGGGMTADLTPKSTGAPIKNEAGNGLKNLRGTIAMARTSVIDSATSQFFINTKDNAFLDHRDTSMQGFGYAVFGKVVAGMEVVDKIGNAPTGVRNRFRDVPVETVTIKSVRRVK